MKRHQRIISGFLALCMVFSMLPVQVFAEETEHTHNFVLFKSGEATCTEPGGSFYLCFGCGDSYAENEVDALGHDYVNHCCTRCGEMDPEVSGSEKCGDNLEWIFDAETGKLAISGSGTMYDFDRDGDSVPWHDVREQITAVVLEPGITTIGNAAFTECHNLVSVSIPDSVNRIGSYAFCGCYALTSIVIPEGVETIEYYTFSGCFELEDVTIPDSITTIARGAFGDTYALETIEIPQNVSYIGPFAFGMSSISTIYFEGDAPTFDSADVEVFFQCYLTAYYPAGNSTWDGIEDLTSSLIGNNGGEIIWLTYNPDGDSHDHSYTATVTNPTCKNQGYTVYSCSCGDSYVSDYVDALGHAYDSGIVIKEPNCDEDGEKLFTCANDKNHTYTNPIPATGHSYVASKVESPTCTEDGYTVYTCGNDNSHTYTEDVPALGHAYDNGVVTKQPGCMTDGIKTFTCANDKTHTYTEEIPATGHTHTAVVTKPTCTEQGYTTYTCSCGDSYVGEYVDALGHSYDEGVVTKQPDCENEGIRTFTCTNDKTHTYTESIPTTEHNHVAVVTKPTCTEQGYTTYTCSCGDSYMGEYVDPIGHAYDKGVVTVEPGCDTDGIKTYTCTNDKTHTYTEPIPAEGHSYTSVTTKPTCTEPGSVVYTCSCGDTLTETLQPIGHDYDDGTVTTKPGCDTEGIKTFTCNNDKEHTYTESIAATGHNYDEGKVITEPDCETEGAKLHTCLNDKNHTYTEVIPATGHYYSTHITQNPKCNEGGYDEYICDCGHSYRDNITPALGHAMGEWETVKAASCEKTGIERRECGRCSYYETYETAATGHSMGAWYVSEEPTTDYSGEERRDCNYCDYYETRPIDRITETSGTCGDDLTWVLYEDGTLVISGTGEMYDWSKNGGQPWPRIKIKKVIVESGVTSIGDYAFDGFINAKTVELPDTLEYIGYYAFQNNSTLTEITIPSSVRSIGLSAFYDCINIKTVNITDLAAWCSMDISHSGANPLSYGADLMLNGKLVTDVVIPDSVDVIGRYVFDGYSKLNSVIIPDHVTGIMEGAFSGCSSLTSVVIPDSVTDFDSSVFYDCYSLETVTLSKNISVIGSYAFSDCYNLTEIKIPQKVTAIGPMAFYNCDALTNVTIPEKVTSIGEDAFLSCNGIKTLSIPGSVTYIGGEAFWDCSGLESVYISDLAAWCKIDYGYRVGDYNGNPLGNGADLYLNGKLVTDLVIPEGVTEIEMGAFRGCTSIKTVVIPDSTTHIYWNVFENCCNLESVTFGSGLTNLYDMVFADCEKLKSVYISDLAAWCEMEYISSFPFGYGANLYLNGDMVTDLIIPEGVMHIASYAFSGCQGIETITFPSSITDIGYDAFGEMGESFKKIRFIGDAPNIEAEAFNEAVINAYYPAGNETWTKDVMKDYGGAITWIPYNPEDGWGEDEDLHDTLDELTDEDYLAFAAIAYKEFGTSGSVKGNLADKWNKPWSKRLDITYAELCKYIANWEVMDISNLSEYNGFYAVAFKNDADEVVIAYRGSESPVDILTDWDWDSFCDWILNDLPMELLNTGGNQLENAISIYDYVALGRDKSKIKVTGHSLGGAWADTVSAYSGCEGITFNAVSVLDVIYKTEPEKMSKIFAGVDQWNFVDHTNQHDILAGMFEEFFSKAMKPYKAHKSNIAVEDNAIWALVGAVAGFFAGGPLGAVAGSVAGGAGTSFVQCHGLDSILTKDSNGELKLTEVDTVFAPTYAITNYMLTANHSVDFGSSAVNNINKVGVMLTPRTTLGGSGNDVIVTSIQDDTLIGGTGFDELDGSWGDDTYIYYWGNGSDLIYDVSGDDKLILSGVDSSAKVTFAEPDDSGFVDILCNGSLVATVSTKNRASVENTFTIEWGKNYTNLLSYLNLKKYSSRIDIQCPVEVDIVDAEGNVVYTIKDGEPGNFYTDYGNFYVYEEEDGGYGKALDLVEGYSVKIVGVGTGTMDISYRDVVNGELSEEKTVTDIPVTDTYEAELEITESGEIELIPLPEHVHEWDEGVVTTEPGCETEGIKTFTCKKDASHVRTEPMAALGHSYEKVVTAPTCTDKGYTTYTCGCGDTYVGDEVAATGHDYKDGTCKICGDKDPNYSKPQKPSWGSILDWIFNHWWKEPCKHNYTSVVTAPTCTKMGYTTHRCSECGICYKDSFKNALGHAWDHGKVTKETTCTKNGEMTYTCGSCGMQKQEVIEARGHQYQNGVCKECGHKDSSCPTVPTKPSKPIEPVKPNKPTWGWGNIWGWIFGGWWK